MPDLYYLERNVLPEEQLLSIAKYIRETSKEGFRAGYYDSGAIQPQQIQSALDICEKTFKDKYDLEFEKLDLVKFFGLIMKDGAENTSHSDENDYHKADGVYYSAVLMLTDEYEGGEFYFEHEGVEIRLNAGDLVMFKGSSWHGVNPVTGGERINIIIFFSNHQ